MNRKTKTSLPWHVTVLAGILVIGGGLLLITSALLWPNPPVPIASAIEGTRSDSAPKNRPTLPNMLKIDRVGITLPIIETQFTATGWEVATNAASIASMSARPYEQGNIIIYSHNTKRLFGRLRSVVVGDLVTLDHDGKERDYRVEAVTVVNPSMVDFLRPTNREALTLYTCTGLFDRQRLVVRAYPIE